MHYMPRKEFNKVFVINVNWLLFSGSVFVILSLVIFSNLFGDSFSRLNCQLCLFLASGVFVVHSIHFWFSKWLMFICHLFYDSLYLVTAFFVASETYLDIVYIWALLAYAVLGCVRLYSYYRIHCGLANVDKSSVNHESGGLIGRHDKTLKRAWHAMLWCGLLNFVLVVALLLLPMNEKNLLTIVSADLFVTGLVFFRIGLAV